ncbi:MAG TPA: hypothetical protein EYP90_14750, partial [Chromatiaceae bacterium]|nr:hypothetical protein [Chromatiaceae bacterium]
MRAQATMEFLMVFLVTIAFIAIIATALVVSGDGAKEQSETIERIIAVEEVTRSVEVLTNSGIAMVFGAEGMEVEIEKEYV